MTSNAIAMTKAVNDNRNKQKELRENKRSNLAREAETYRSNRAKENLDKYKTDMAAASKQSVKVGGITVTGAPASAVKMGDAAKAIIPGASSAAGAASTGKSGTDSDTWKAYDKFRSDRAKAHDLW